MLAWDDFRLCKAIADARSLAGAADILDVNTSTVFRRLGALETRLAARLFDRRRAGYALTPAGEEMVTLAQRIADEVTTIERRIAGRDLKPSGELRVTTNDALIAHGLTPILARFRQAYPEIRLEVVSSNDALNLSRRDADIAIRVSAKPPDTLIGRRISSMAWAIYGQANELAVESIDDLAHRHWVMPGDNLSQLKIARAIASQIPRDRIVYTLSTVCGLGEAIEAGIGIGPLPCYIGERMGLTRILSLDCDSEEAALWILTHPDIRGSARVRVFLEFVGAELAKLRTEFECD